jgi:putative ATP-dependent endonuclease of OLD family
MLVKTLKVKNFRCVKDETLHCEILTALVGPNGSGKSTFLKALQLFYDSSPRIDHRDFYDEDVTQSIEIALTFSDLGPKAIELFSNYLEGEEFTVERVFSFVEGKLQHKYYGSRLSISDFRPVYSASNATDAKKRYQALDAAGTYAGLPTWANREQALESLMKWEESHPEQRSRCRDEGQFFGFTGVGQGYLGRFTRLIYVPAVRDAGSDADEGKDSPVKEIVDLVVRNSLATHKSIQALKEETKRLYDEIVDPSKLTGLQTLQEDLNRTLKAYVVDASVELDWLPSGEIQLPLPKTDVTLSEDGYPCTVSRSGHGLQRAFILTMLQHLAVARPASESSSDNAANEKPEAAASAGVAPEQSDMILCIEEPEVYQHPNRQRHFASILLRIASGTIEGVARKTQVIYSTHSPMFVGLDRFDQVRLFRKVIADAEKPKCTKSTRATMDQIAEELWQLNGRPGEKYTGKSLLPRLQPIMTPWMNEGFFGDIVVLVEGEGDLAALVGVAKSRGVSFEALGISVIPCIGKANLDRPALIFRALGIPVFLVWDSDEGDRDRTDSPKKNRLLLRLMSEPETDYPSLVKDRFACFKVKLEATLERELGSEFLVNLLKELQAEFGVDSPKDCLKKPAVVSELISRAKAKGKTCTTLELIVDKILGLHAALKQG